MVGSQKIRKDRTVVIIYINPNVRRTSYDGILTKVGYELEYMGGTAREVFGLVFLEGTRPMHS
jgi:hypothetical protein